MAVGSRRNKIRLKRNITRTDGKLGLVLLFFFVSCGGEGGKREKRRKKGRAVGLGVRNVLDQKFRKSL